MTNQAVCNLSILKSLSPEWTVVLPRIREEICKSNYKIVILDDDPTGTQTAKDLPVFTH